MVIKAGEQGWRETRRYVVGLVVAYVILIQALASPFLQVQAAEKARFGGAMAALCQTDGVPQPDAPHGHGLDCCLPGARFAGLDQPFLLPHALVFPTAADEISRRVAYVRPQSRAPPSALTLVLQPRAPPISIL